MTNLNQDDLRTRFVLAMGEELGVFFWHLNQKVLNLHVLWQQYMELYGENEDVVRVLNRNAGFFFRVVQGEFWDSVLLGICRLTDPAEMRGRPPTRNLSLKALPSLISDAGLKSKIFELSEIAVSVGRFARSHRNKRLAHQDIDYLTGIEPLAGVNRKLIGDALRSIREVMNAINLHFFDSSTFYEETQISGGAKWLAERLRTLE